MSADDFSGSPAASQAGAVTPTANESWSAFVDRLAQERKREGLPRATRAFGEDFVRRALPLLFPQFAKVDADCGFDMHLDASKLEQSLRRALGTLVNDVDATAAAFLDRLPHHQAMLLLDAEAIHTGDPASESLDEVILAYPGFLAIAVHRMSHELYRLKVPLLPRLMSEWAHRETGIDIHPGAEIGASFAIDHGTGIVIGETSVIGDRVRIYQGVTLGALAVSKQLANRKRHPTIGNDVVLYANATILGGNTVVGDGSVVGGNVWLTSSVPPRSVVQFTSTVAKRASDDGLEFHI